MLCPQCNQSFPELQECPKCGVPLVAEATSSTVIQLPGPTKWQQTAWGRCLIGLVLAQGLYYTLAHLVTAMFMAMGLEGVRSPGWRDSATGLVVLQFLKALSLAAGGMVAGASQRRGVLYGAIVGVHNGFVFLLVEVMTGPQLGHQGFDAPTLVLISQPVLHALFGAAGAYLGRRLWQPIILFTLDKPAVAPAGSSQGAAVLERTQPRDRSLFAGPIAWLQVGIGSLVAVAGAQGANEILKRVLEKSELFVETTFQSQFITWEIAVLALIIGGAVGGANTRNGLKQGLAVGIAASIMLIGLLTQQEQTLSRPPAQTLAFYMCNFSLGMDLFTQNIVFTILGVLPVAMLGGWFGGQLLPPVYRPRKRKSQYFPAPA